MSLPGSDGLRRPKPSYPITLLSEETEPYGMKIKQSDNARSLFKL
jgi:hypothetical protein